MNGTHCLRPTILALLLALGGFLAPRALAQAAPPGLRIKLSCVCRSLDEAFNPVNEVPAGPVREGPLTVWLVISGDREALAWLRAQQRKYGPQTLTHDWVRIGDDGVAPAPPDSARADVEAIRAGTLRHYARLGAGGKDTGSGLFDWRTWSTKENFEPGTYSVRVRVGRGAYLRDSSGSEVIAAFTFKE